MKNFGLDFYGPLLVFSKTIFQTKAYKRSLRAASKTFRCDTTKLSTVISVFSDSLRTKGLLMYIKLPLYFPTMFSKLNSIKNLSMKVLSTLHKWCLFYDSLFLKPIIKINFDDFVSFCQCWFCQSFCEVVVWRRFLGLFINFCDLIQHIYESWIIFVKISFQKNSVKVKK